MLLLVLLSRWLTSWQTLPLFIGTADLTPGVLVPQMPGLHLVACALLAYVCRQDGVAVAAQGVLVPNRTFESKACGRI